MGNSYYTSKMSAALQQTMVEANNSGDSAALAVADHVDNIHGIAIDESGDPDRWVYDAMENLIRWARQFREATGHDTERDRADDWEVD